MVADSPQQHTSTLDPSTGETVSPPKRKPGRPKGSGKKHFLTTDEPKVKRPVGRPRKDGLPAGSLGVIRRSRRSSGDGTVEPISAPQVRHIITPVSKANFNHNGRVSHNGAMSAPTLSMTNSSRLQSGQRPLRSSTHSRPMTGPSYREPSPTHSSRTSFLLYLHQTQFRRSAPASKKPLNPTLSLFPLRKQRALSPSHLYTRSSKHSGCRHRLLISL